MPLLTPRLAVGITALAMATCALAPWTSPASAAAPTVSVSSVQLRVTVGPQDELCNLDVDIYTPSTATAARPAPVVLSSNGYLGNKAQTGAAGAPGTVAAFFAKQGYVGVSYSGLGWGGSSCSIQLDSPEWDGRAAAQLLDYLGGDTSRAFRAYTRPVAGVGSGTWATPVRARPPVLLDGPGDPRSGFLGTSYGGGAAFAAAASSRKLDTIVTQATWSDLTYSLAPNDLVQAGQDIRIAEREPGVAKAVWISALSAGGPSQVAQGTGGGRIGTCPGFDPRICPGLAGALTRGYASGDITGAFQASSPLRYAAKIRIPTYLLQGQADSLFNLREAAAMYTALRRQGTPVKMVWQHWGHSDQVPAAGEENLLGAPATSLNGQRYLAWMDTHLRGRPDTTGQAFQWQQDWSPYGGRGPNDEQQGSAPAYPLSTAETFTLTGGVTSSGVLAQSGGPAPGSTTLVTSPVTTTSYSETPGAGRVAPPTDAPGTAVSYTSSPLVRPLDVVGSGTLTIRLDAPAFATSQTSDPGGRLVLFAKLYDVAPDGTVTLPAGLVSAVRVPDVTRPLQIALPAVVHRFAAGHRLRLVLAQGDSSYKGNLIAAPVTVVERGARLTIPVSQRTTSPTPVAAATPASAPRGTAVQPSAATLPATGPRHLPAAAAAALLAGGVLRRVVTRRARTA